MATEKQIHVKLDRDLHTRLKVRAAETEMSLNELVVAALRAFLTRGGAK